MATWLLSRSPVCVLLPEYEQILRGKYKASRVYTVPIGALGKPCHEVHVPESDVLLCFGIFGTHKKLEMLLKVMEALYTKAPLVKLRIVGGSNSHTPTYLDDLKAKYTLPNVEFVGYVTEEDVPYEFTNAKAVVMPYVTMGGASGTLIQAGIYGKPILVSDLPFFRRSEMQNYALNFFENDPDSIKEAILRLMEQPVQVLISQGQQNRAEAARNSMEDVCRIYLGHIENILKPKKLKRLDYTPTT